MLTDHPATRMSSARIAMRPIVNRISDKMAKYITGHTFHYDLSQKLPSINSTQFDPSKSSSTQSKITS